MSKTKLKLSHPKQLPLKYKPVIIQALVDDLGTIKAKIADLEASEEDIRQKLVDAGLDEIEGRMFRCTISHSEVVRVDYKAVVEALPPSANLTRLLNCNTINADRVTVKVVAR